MGTATFIFLLGLAVVLAGWQALPRINAYLEVRRAKRLREEASEQFLELITPIRDRIAGERADHRTAWITSRMEIANACSLLGPHLDDVSVSRLDAAYLRYTKLSEKTLEPRKIGTPPPGEGFRLDYASVKEAMLEPIREMVQIAQQG
ncbi:hypothetical protein GC207_08335 [bacterium]|nr:hypothetical protein [bacterium]